MTYATEADAGFRLTSLTHNATAQDGPISASYEEDVQREDLAAGANNTPISSPVDMQKARVVHRFLSLEDRIAIDASPASCTAAFTAADGGSGSVVHGPMLAGSTVFTMARNMGGFAAEQTFTFQGTSLTKTVTI